MGKLPGLKPCEVCRMLEALGFALVRQRGSHMQYRHADGRGTTVPNHAGRDISPILFDDPRYGAKTLTIDTRTGLVWLDLPVSSGFSYLQAAEATQPGGLFEGFTHATVEKLFALYRGAGIAGPGWYPESSSSLQPILSLVSLVGATSSQDGRPEAFGISGIGVNGWHWGVGLDFIYLDGVPGYVEQTGICMGDTTRSAEWGNWLVQPIPEPSSWRLGLLAVLAFLGTRLLTGRHHDAPNEPPPSLAVGNSDGFGGRRSVS